MPRQGGRQLWTGGGKGHCWKVRGRNRQRGGAGPTPAAPRPGQDTHLSVPRLLLRKRRAILVTSSVRLHVAWSISLPNAARSEPPPSQNRGPSPRAEPKGVWADSPARPPASRSVLPRPARPSGHSHEPVQPPNHQLLSPQQSPCQPQGLVAGTQDALKHTAGQADVLHPDPAGTLLPASWGPPPHLSCAVICLQVHFGDKLGNVQSSCG